MKELEHRKVKRLAGEIVGQRGDVEQFFLQVMVMVMVMMMVMMMMMVMVMVMMIMCRVMRRQGHAAQA